MSQMTPSCSCRDSGDSASPDIVFAGEFIACVFSRVIKHSYFLDVLWSKLCHRVFLAWEWAAVFIAATGHFIGNILSIFSKIKMCRIYTRPNIASMKNVHAIWYWIDQKSPNGSRGAPPLSVHGKCAISVTFFVGGPYPAAVGVFGYFNAESIRKVMNTSHAPIYRMIRFG